MKNYKKGLLAAMVLSAMSLMAAEDKTIQVTTFADEDGENLQACSLREAIKTAKLDKSYGGCNVGRTIRHDGTAPDVIQLESGVYKLDRELVVESSVNIFGKTAFNYSKRSPITNLYPTKEPLTTIIDGQGKTRLFSSMETQASLNVNQVILKDGYAAKDPNVVNSGNGGAFAVAGSLGIFSSEIVNARAAAEGGAIYAVGQNSEKTIKIEDSLLQGNSAESYGSVFAMDCRANLTSTQIHLEVNSSSIIGNGSPLDRSTIDVCGQTTVAISNSTIAQNTAKEQILKFVHAANRPLISNSSFTAINNTIVQNTAPSVLNYDNVGSIGLGYNVLAFNEGQSCLYALNGGDPTVDQNLRFSFYHNAIQTSGRSQCTLPKQEEGYPFPYKYVDVSAANFSDLLRYLEPAVDNRFLGIYYPIDHHSETDLVDSAGADCLKIDQRGIERITDATLILDPMAKNTCDIGSIEARRLTAADVEDLKNNSLTDLLAYFQENIDDIKSILKSEDNSAEEIAGLNEELKEFEDLLKYTKQHQKYRAIYVNPFNLAMPNETLDGTAVKLELLNSDNFDVEMKVLGVGTLTGTGGATTVDGIQDPALKCEWKPEMSRIMMYRTDGKVTSLTDSEYCSYTLRHKKTGVTSAGILKASFNNIAPVAKNDEYRIDPSNNLTVTVNPLENDHDDGDGPISTINGNKTAFYVNKDGLETPIRIVDIESGLTVTAERQGPCPDTYQAETCYGGKLTFAARNNFSQYDYHVGYTIFDADALMSNTATITLKNSAKNTNSQSSGGGAMSLFGLFGLLGLAVYRSRRFLRN